MVLLIRVHKNRHFGDVASQLSRWTAVDIPNL